MTPLTLALERLTVADVWALLGLEGNPKRYCRSPFRPDRNPSFSIYEHARRWKDHATGAGGDAADFVAAALNCSPQEGCRRLIELAGTGRKDNVNCKSNNHQTQTLRREHDSFRDPKKAIKRQKWSSFELPTPAEIKTIAARRGLSPEGVTLGVEAGLLFRADLRKVRAWVLSDSNRINAQARRLDGKPWVHIDGQEAWTLPGSVGSWPIGLRESHLADCHLPDDVIEAYATAFYHKGKFVIVRTEPECDKHVMKILRECGATRVNQHDSNTVV